MLWLKIAVIILAIILIAAFVFYIDYKTKVIKRVDKEIETNYSKDVRQW